MLRMKPADLCNTFPCQLGNCRKPASHDVEVVRLPRQLGNDTDVRGYSPDAVMKLHDDVLFLPDVALLLPNPLLIEPDLFLFRLLAVGYIEESHDDRRRTFIVDDPCCCGGPANLVGFGHDFEFILPGNLPAGNPRLAAFPHQLTMVGVDDLPELHAGKFVSQ